PFPYTTLFRSLVPNQTVVFTLQSTNHVPDVELLRQRLSLLSHADRHVWMGQELQDPIGHAADIPRLDEVPIHTIPNHFRRTIYAGPHDRHAAGQRLQIDPRQSLPE